MMKLCRLLPLFFICISAHAQNPVQVFTPNAASLGQYGQIPVNYFNGLPEISIPLTTFKAKGYELPIRLSYHASGNNPDSHPGWVGLGWSLRAGGMINRIIKGYKDEKSETEFQYLSNVGYGDSQSAYYYHSEQMQNSNWSDEAYLSKISGFSAVARPLGTEPDEFQVNIDDIQASFYIVGNNKIKIKSKTNANFKVNIKLNTSNSNLVLYKNTRGSKDMASELFTFISEIVIIKDDGTKYYFGGDMNAIEFSCVQYPKYALNNTVNTNEWKSIGTANSWLLKRIELTNGEVVNFDYEKSGTPVIMSDNHYGEAYVLDGNSAGSLFDTKGKIDRYYNMSFTFIRPSYLKSIKSEVTKNEIYFYKSKTNELEYNITKSIFNFRVGNFRHYDFSHEGEFSYEKLMAQNYYMQLDEMVEKNKRIKFRYNNDSQSRLRLSSVAFLDNNGGEVYSYNLSYNGLKLPPYNSKKTDKWGYYNNKYYGNINYENLGTYRTPDENYMQAELLTGITYPTGGHSEFVYEAHRYARIAEQFDFAVKPNSGTAGGLRIKEIKTTENGKSSTRTFEYTDSLGKSSGILSGNHLYYARGRQHIKFHYSRWWGLVYQKIKVDYKATYYIVQENNINQLSTTNGNHVTYSRIVEKLSDGSKIVYTYSNHDQYMDETPIKMLDNINNEVLTNSFISKELERGLLLKTEYLNSLGIPVRSEINQYNSSPDRYNDFVKSVNQMVLVGGNIRRISALKLYTFYPYLESKTTILHDSLTGGSLTTLTKYEYNANKLVVKTSTVNSKGEDEFEVISYSGDMKSDTYKRMQDKYMLSFPVEKTLVRNNHVVRSELSTYRKNDSNGDYLPSVLYKAQINSPLLYSQFARFDGGSRDRHYGLPEIEYTRFDRNSNITEFVMKGTHPTTCIWGYNNEYPVAVFENARNDYKITSRYEDYRESVSVSLSRNNESQNRQTYDFYSSRSGTVEINMSGALGYNWYISGMLDREYFSLVSMRSNDDVGLPWTDYQYACKSKVEFYVSEGYHKLQIISAKVYKGSAAGEYDGDFQYTYWSQRSIKPYITGNNDVFYVNFENYHSDNAIPFGFHSSKSYVGTYSVELPSNPNKQYKIDYQVYKNGKWNYKIEDFNNGTYTINEGNNPIDEIRVYPKDASVSTYTYLPPIGLRSKTDSRGITESYDYDILGRLKAVKDVDNYIVKSFDYKYYKQKSDIIPQTYYNVEQRSSFTSKRCDRSLGEVSESVEYVVPAGKYTSAISQEDANRKALEDLQNNGQQYADENAKCISHIIVSVYNPTNESYILEYAWGAHGSIKTPYAIPPGRRIADTGDVLRDYQPTILYVPRINYRWIHITRGVPGEFIPLSIKSYPHGYDIFYKTSYYSDYKDTYVIGNYSFPD